MRNLFALCFFGIFMIALSSCGETPAADAEDVVEEVTEEATEAATEAVEEAVEEVIDESGPEYTSAYICPMHCAGSGSEEAGVCPACGMDYVMNENHEGHDHGEEGHSH